MYQPPLTVLWKKGFQAIITDRGFRVNRLDFVPGAPTKWTYRQSQGSRIRKNSAHFV